VPHILSRYILRETVGTWLGITGALLVILLTNQIAAVLTRAAEQGFPRGVVLELVWFGTLSNLAVMLPIGLMLGVVVAFGRLYHDSEMTAVLACGVDRWRIHAPVILLAIVLSSIVAWLTLVGASAAAARVEALRASALQAGEFAPITPGRFRSFGGGSVVFYAGAVGPDGILERVFVKRVRDGRYEIATAARARHSVSADGDLQTLTLFEGERYEGLPGSSEFRIVRFTTNVIPVRVPSIAAGARDLDAVPTSTLIGSRDLALRAELHWRMAMPLMVFVLAMLAVPISRVRPRQGRYSRLWLAIVVYFVYLSMVSVAEVWMAKGVMPAALGVWWVHVVVVVPTLFLVAGPDLRAHSRYRYMPTSAGAA